MPDSPFNNKNLFSNHYLENQLKAAPEWGRDDHLAAFEEIRRIYERESAFVANLSESQLEDRLFRSLFAVILPDYEVQVGTKSGDFPDYAFFPDRSARDRAQERKNTESFFKGAFAVGEVKRWDAELDRFGKDREDKRRNPSFQIWLYLHKTEPAWGILSNGQKWRLYRQENHLDVYYEVDLAAILEKRDVDAFRYFYYFFRQEAFLPNERGEVFLDEVLRGSANYAREIGENLKENVYRAMKILADGFIRWPENGLDPTDPETRARVQRNTMILLYRFLFLLYAEGKELLDLRDEVYASSYSFDRIKKEVATRLDGPASQAYLPIKRSLWSDLNDLFRLIDQGSRNLGIDGVISVPAYNGGLFDPQKHPDLAKWTIGDSHLAEAIDLLSRSEAGAGGAEGRKGFVDYSTLEIRHLGSIYEGLLEYRLEVADGDLVVSGGKDRRWVPLEEFNRGKKKEKSFSEFGEFERARAGDLYLTTDRGERKATGSYYTPDYIVDYIVEKTVGPVVKERCEEALLENRSLIEATLSVKVLDPAMGSGHFLVGAVEFLAGKLMEAAERDIEWGWVEDHGQFTSEWAKREAVSSSIYGVDLNELAVELAKVSLWLITIAKDKPLSFLDHRLKQGNSLVGARLSDLITYPGEKVQGKGKEKDKDKGQVTLPSFVSPRFLQHLIGKIRELEEIGDDSLSEIKRKEEVFEEFRSLPEYTRAKAIANVHTAVYFGNEVKPTTYEGKVVKESDAVYHDLFWAVAGEEAEWRRPALSAWFREAQRIAEERGFFHWQLEFPEVFFEGGAVKENPGWDAVVGNPPYDVLIRSEQGDYLINYVNINYYTSEYNPNLFALFIELGIKLTRFKGGISLIVPNMWLTNDKYTKTRSILINETQLLEIMDLQFTAFEEIIPTCIFISTKRSDLLNQNKTKIGINQNKQRTIPSKYSEVEQLDLKLLIENGFGNYLSEMPNLIVGSSFTDLEEYYIIYRGVETRDNKKYLSTRMRDELDKPILNATDVGKYQCYWGGLYVRFIPKELKSNADINMYVVPQKVLLRRTGDSLIACVDCNGYLATKNLYILIPKSSHSAKYCCVLLNSKLMNWERTRRTRDKGQAFAQLKGSEIASLPIRRISFSTPEDERRRLTEELKGLCVTGRYREVLELVDECLPKDEEGEFIAEAERSDIVHDLLAYLAEEMIRMNKEKQEEIRGFLGWLEGDMGANVEDLTNKTKVQSYYEYEFGDLLAVLKKNKRKLKEDYSTRKPQERVKLEYENSIATLKPLLSRIKDTDDLIDQVVYKLYGLTEDEIDIVTRAT
jgi:type I restriction-modification system DNA methylase subunit